MDKCRYAVKYKAIRIPGCDCELCWKKWLLREIADKLGIKVELGGLDSQDVLRKFTALSKVIHI